MSEQIKRDKGTRNLEELRALAEQVKISLFSNQGIARLGALKKDVPDYENYELYHCIAGSGIFKDDELAFDTPNHDFEKFIEDLLVHPIEQE
jgi:hypothetical protein